MRLIINSAVLHHKLVEQKIALGFKNRPAFNHPTRRQQDHNPVALITTRFKFLEMIKREVSWKVQVLREGVKPRCPRAGGAGPGTALRLQPDPPRPQLGQENPKPFLPKEHLLLPTLTPA